MLLDSMDMKSILEDRKRKLQVELEMVEKYLAFLDGSASSTSTAAENPKQHVQIKHTESPRSNYDIYDVTPGTMPGSILEQKIHEFLEDRGPSYGADICKAVGITRRANRHQLIAAAGISRLSFGGLYWFTGRPDPNSKELEVKDDGEIPEDLPTPPPCIPEPSKELENQDPEDFPPYKIEMDKDTADRIEAYLKRHGPSPYSQILNGLQIGGQTFNDAIPYARIEKNDGLWSLKTL